MFFNSIFFEFSPFWPPKTKPKSRFFCYFFENVDFMKIVLPSRRNCYFSRCEPPKNDKKSMPTSTSKKTSKKTLQKSIFPSKLASPNLPKSTKNRKKLQKIAFEKKLVKNSHGNEITEPDLKLFGTLPDYPITFPMISTS